MYNGLRRGPELPGVGPQLWSQRGDERAIRVAAAQREIDPHALVVVGRHGLDGVDDDRVAGNARAVTALHGDALRRTETRCGGGEQDEKKTDVRSPGSERAQRAQPQAYRQRRSQGGSGDSCDQKRYHLATFIGEGPGRRRSGDDPQREHLHDRCPSPRFGDECSRHQARHDQRQREQQEHVERRRHDGPVLAESGKDRRRRRSGENHRTGPQQTGAIETQQRCTTGAVAGARRHPGGLPGECDHRRHHQSSDEQQQQPTHYRLLGKRVHRAGGAAAGEEGTKQHKQERSCCEDVAPPFARPSVQVRRCRQPGQQRRVLHRIPRPEPAPSQLDVGPV